MAVLVWGVRQRAIDRRRADARSAPALPTQAPGTGAAEHYRTPAVAVTLSDTTPDTPTGGKYGIP
jgi:hypothetical protein